MTACTSVAESVFVVFADVEEFLSKKTELNYLQLKRQQELFVCSGQLPVTPQVDKCYFFCCCCMSTLLLLFVTLWQM